MEISAVIGRRGKNSEAAHSRQRLVDVDTHRQGWLPLGGVSHPCLTAFPSELKAPPRMPTARQTSRVAGLASAILVVAVIPACRNAPGARPYSSARPVYSPPSVQPLRIGGYAGMNYGQGPRLPPVEEVEVLDPLR